jgi:4-diphosphocytidyl-2-C-methyl-D-erythritol kinase
MRQEVGISAPAKINLILRVLDRRPDGYHNLWSLMQTVGLEDELHLRLRQGSPGISIECNDPSLPTDGRNLAARAAEIVLDQARLAVRLHITITKRIPVSAGLGGGSSDAASTIVGLNRLLDLGWSLDDMVSAGRILGSDVPFFFSAPTALVSGRGEVAVPMRITGRRWIVLINPGFPIETRWAYDQLSASRSTIRTLSNSVREIAGKTSVSWEELIPLMENDFEEVLASTHPMLGQIRAGLLSAGAQAALLSGSGATVFGVFNDESTAIRVRDRFQNESGWWASAVQANSDALIRDEAPRGPFRVS